MTASDPTPPSAPVPPTKAGTPGRIALLARVAATMSPRMVVIKSLAYAVRVASKPFRALSTGGKCSYPKPDEAGGAPEPRLGPPDLSAIAANAATIRDLAALYLDHRFDLLGSGWVRVAYGETYPGFEGHLAPPGPALPADRDRAQAITAHLRRGNRKRARAILGLIDDPQYRPIDWHVDFRSGHRWSPAEWGRTITQVPLPGVDIKLPWELARFQHAPVLAQAYALARAGHPGFASPDRLVAEFRNQVLDFIGANPPGWGVNWACPMDVAIRAANLLVGWDLFRAQGVTFDAAFEGELAASALAHGRHVYRHLEWHELYRANHYLANICGMAFIAAYLPDTPEHPRWVDFAACELEAEVPRQFAPDGGCFEASTAYHRLSAEMALYTAGLLTALERPPSAMVRQRLAAAIRFAQATTLPSGRMIQIGDTDSGRLFKAAPLCDSGSDGPVERVLDPGELFAAAAGLFDPPPPAPAAAAFATWLMAGLAGGARFADAAPPPAPPPADTAARCPPGLTVRIEPPDPTALEGLEPLAFPEFGLYLWRGPRALVAVRCGPIGQNGRGGHAHNDQLAVEIEIDGVPWARDPGSYVFAPDLAARDRYRSVMAHFAPRRGAAEPARLLAPFRLEDSAQAEALRFGPDFLGRHVGFGEAIYRRVAIEAGAIVIEDGPAPSETWTVRRPEDLAARWGLETAFSPGYGRCEG